MVRCVGKGERERVLPVRDRAADVVERYLTDARPVLLKGRLHEALFVNRRGTRLTRQGFWGILKNYALAAGIESHVTPQVLRDSFAIHMLNGGTSVEDIQVLLGHANAARAQRYAESASVTSRKLVSQCTILISCQLAVCSSTSSPDAAMRSGGGSSVTIVM